MMNKEIPTDREIIAGCIACDKRSQELLIRKFSDTVYTAIRYILKAKSVHFESADIEDLHSDIFLKLFEKKCRKLAMFEGKNGCSLNTWISVIATRTVIDYIRKTNTDVMSQTVETDTLDTLRHHDASVPDPLVMLEKADQNRLLEKGMKKLSPREQVLLRLHCMKNLSIRETARIMGITETNAYAIKHRAVNQLKTTLKTYQYEKY